MPDLNDLYFFVQVVDHGGFAPAGRALSVPKSRLSRRIAGLEERLGVRLIQRSTRRFSVTDIGQVYYLHCKAMLVEANAAQEAIDVTRAEPCGVVRVSCPIALLEATVSKMLAGFMARYPGVEIHLEATNRRVDVVSEGIDIAIRVRPPPLQDSDLVMRVLGERRQCLVASAALFENHDEPKVPADLSILPSLALDSPHTGHAWDLFGPDNAQAHIKHSPRLVTGDMTMLREAAMAGVGIVQLPNMMVRNELASGDLLRLLPDWAPRADIAHAVFASRRGLLPSVRALIDYLGEKFATLDDR